MQQQPLPVPLSPCWRGKLELTYGHSERGTHIQHSYTEAPLRLQRPFYPEGPERCQSVIVHTAGGMVAGDRLDLCLRLQPGAQALVTTAAAAKIYRSTGLEAQQSVDIRVEAGACLEWLPQETIVFDQARYRQQMQVWLAPGAQWIGWEVTRLGRTARGEQFVAGDWRSHTAVYQRQADAPQTRSKLPGDRPLWIDRQWLSASPERLGSPHGLGGCPVIGSLAWLGATVDDALIAQARQHWHSLISSKVSLAGQHQAGVTRLNAGLLCRYRGHSTTLANRWFRQVWQLIRQQQAPPVCASPPLPAQIPRVWQ